MMKALLFALLFLEANDSCIIQSIVSKEGIDFSHLNFMFYRYSEATEDG